MINHSRHMIESDLEIVLVTTSFTEMALWVDKCSVLIKFIYFTILF